MSCACCWQCVRAKPLACRSPCSGVSDLTHSPATAPTHRTPSFNSVPRHLRHHPVAVRRARRRARHRRRERHPQHAPAADEGRRRPPRRGRRQPSLCSPFAATVTVAPTDAVSLSEDHGGPRFIVVAVAVSAAAGRRSSRGRHQ